MESEKKPSKSLSTTVIVAIISLISAVTVALIAKWPSQQKVLPDDKPSNSAALIPNADSISLSDQSNWTFCDKIEVIIKDAQNNFKTIIGPQTFDQSTHLTFDTKVQLEDLPCGIIYGKDDKHYDWSADIYKGPANDTSTALGVLHDYITKIDACLGVKNKKQLYISSHNFEYVQDYLTEDWEVEVRIFSFETDSGTEDIEGELTIGKNTEL